MNYDNVTTRLLTVVPQIRPHYEKGMEWLEEELPHVLFGIMVVPFIIKNLEENKPLDVMFNFIEEMSLSSDERIQELVVVSVIESLIVEREIIHHAKSSMGKRTRELCDDIEREFGY
ncbi:hypothetical protein ACFYU8_27995 [Brevibacillus sp. NPDC003359]|uniref:DUF7674 family protein n=1 Tax=unclassified Brevibacillus TaxID=2684853 RepID=UPI0036A64EE3